MTTRNDLVPTTAEIKEIGDGSVTQLAKALSACSERDQGVYGEMADEIANIYGVKGMYVLVKCVIARIVALGPQGPGVMAQYTVLNMDGTPIPTDPGHLARNPQLRAMVTAMRLVTAQLSADDAMFDGLWQVLAEDVQEVSSIVSAVGYLLVYSETQPDVQRCDIGPAVFDPDGCTVYATDNGADSSTFDMAEQLVIHHRASTVVIGLALVDNANAAVHTAFASADARHIAAMLILEGGYTASGAPIQSQDGAVDIRCDDAGNVVLAPMGKSTDDRRLTFAPEEARRMAVRLLAAADRAPEGTP